MAKKRKEVQIKLHLGCGKRDFGKEWIHVDGTKFPHVVFDNITKLDHFKNDFFHLMYASHVIEYFDREEVIPVLEEWVRVLRPGGILRLAVPDFRAMAALYIMGHQGKKFELDSFIGPLYGKMDMNGQKIYHKTVWDYDTLKPILESVGLTTIRSWRWQDVDHGKIDDHSQAYLPHMDKEKGTLISLNMEGVKA